MEFHMKFPRTWLQLQKIAVTVLFKAKKYSKYQ